MRDPKIVEKHQPIHVAAVGLGNIRFFRSPLDGPRQPWHSIDDLYAAMTLPRSLRRALKAGMPSHKEWKKSIRTIQTEKGETTIAPHWMAQGIIGSAMETKDLSKDFETAYTFAMVEAMKALTVGMSPLDGMNYGLAAFRNENGLPPIPPLDERSVIFRPGPEET